MLHCYKLQQLMKDQIITFIPDDCHSFMQHTSTTVLKVLNNKQHIEFTVKLLSNKHGRLLGNLGGNKTLFVETPFIFHFPVYTDQVCKLLTFCNNITFQRI